MSDVAALFGTALLVVLLAATLAALQFAVDSRRSADKDLLGRPAHRV